MRSRIDWLNAAAILSFVLTIVFDLMPNSGSDAGKLIANLATIFEILTIVLVIVAIGRAVIRWRQRGPVSS